MGIVGWTGWQENAEENFGLHTETNRNIHKQKQKSMVGVKPHFLLEVFNTLYTHIVIMNSRVKATVESTVIAQCCSLTFLRVTRQRNERRKRIHQ
jgi:hypothetical protein